MKRIFLGLFLVAFITLLLELALLRVFDVILYSNISYLVITSALFCFGLAGVYSSLNPLSKSENIRKYVAKLSFLFSISAIIILPIMNILPFDYGQVTKEPITQLFAFLAMYFFLALPFFFAGLIFTSIFSFYSGKIQNLYFWDLSGAALGSILIIPFIPLIGPGGVLFIVSGLAIFTSGLFSNSKNWTIISIIISLILIAIPFTKDGYYDFNEHANKRDIRRAENLGRIELTYWDPISKIEIVDNPKHNYKHIAYDGGSQSSFIYPFDGDFKSLRKELPDSVLNHFWNRGVLASHYLKENSNQNVLIIGSAGGQETKAALTCGAKHIDAVEMVGEVVKLGKLRYSKFNGNIFNNPRVNCFVGEGRSYLRSTSKKYDIIQIFSNHTSSSIAAGTGAMATTYLQTAEAYQEYFNHLTLDGILQINHHIYPKEITTAALAWKELGKKDFKKHVIVYERMNRQDNLPTLLIKMTPWTQYELDRLNDFFSMKTDETRLNWVYQLVVDPLHKENNFLSDEFFSGDLSSELISKIPFRVLPSTDNRPYFNFLRKIYHKIEPDSSKFLNISTASLLNGQIKGGILPMDVIHLIVTAILSIIFIILFIVIPLYKSKAGKSKDWYRKKLTLMYFGCLGAGFIIFELVFIQIFMKLIGSPLYTYSSIVFILLLSAGIGSYSSKKLKISLEEKWYIPFIGIIFFAFIIILIHSYIFSIFLASPILIRIIVSAVLISPLGFFLGMPFPLGILAAEVQPEGAIAWAWGLNGLFTVVGGFLSVILSIFFGFVITLIVSIVIYTLAFLIFSQIRFSKQYFLNID